jgi:radical SAM superfamily enzyme YgiQ (UPF0313 family)
MGKILLINPEAEINRKQHIDKKNYSCFPSLGLGYVASVLEKAGHIVQYIDMRASNISLADFERLSSLGKYSNIDLFGITATTPLINTALKLSSIIKKHYPHSKIIIGGVHASALPDEVLASKHVDIVVRGEGEYTFRDLAAGVKLGEIKGISYKDKKGKIIHNPDTALIEKLDDLPLPAYHLMPMEKYYPSPGSYKRLPAMSLVVTRGCYGKCTFCNPITRGKVRSRSARKIVDEIKYLQKKYGIKEIGFFDDLFTGDRDNVEEMCNLILQEKVDVTWSCFTRANFVEENLFAKMKKAGCHTVLFGVESGSQEILDRMKKGQTLLQIKKSVALCKKLGFEIRASYIFGAIGETEDTLKKTMDLALNLDTDHAIFTIMTPYPGTEVWKEARIHNWPLEKNYDLYIGETVTMMIPTVSKERIQQVYDSAYKKFYLRPKILFRQLSKMNSFLVLKQNIEGVMGLIFKGA